MWSKPPKFLLCFITKVKHYFGLSRKQNVLKKEIQRVFSQNTSLLLCSQRGTMKFINHFRKMKLVYFLFCGSFTYMCGKKLFDIKLSRSYQFFVSLSFIHQGNNSRYLPDETWQNNFPFQTRFLFYPHKELSFNKVCFRNTF